MRSYQARAPRRTSNAFPFLFIVGIFCVEYSGLFRPLLQLFIAPWPQGIIADKLQVHPPRTYKIQRAAAQASKGDSEDVKQLLDLQKSDLAALWLWSKFRSGNSIPAGTRISDVPEHVIQEFLASYSGGSLDSVELTSADLLSQFNKLGAADPSMSWQWLQYSFANAFGLLNPTRLPAVVVQEFISQYKAGVLSDVELATEALADKLRAFQKEGGQLIWNAYCKEQGLGIVSTREPQLLPADFIKRFLGEYVPCEK